MGLSLFTDYQWEKVKAEAHCRNRATIPNPRRGAARLRACSHGRERGDHHTGVAFAWRLNRSLHRANSAAMPRCAPGWETRRIFPNLLSLREVLQIGTQPMGSSAVGDLSGLRIRTASGACRRRGLAQVIVAVSQESPGPGAKNGALHLQRHEALLQVWRQVGIFERESDGRETCRIAARFDQANETTSAINPCLVLSAFDETAITGKTGSGILRLAWSSHQRGLRSPVAGFGFGQGRRYFSTRFRPGPDHAAENGGFANESPAPGRSSRPAASMAV